MQRTEEIIKLILVADELAPVSVDGGLKVINRDELIFVTYGMAQAFNPEGSNQRVSLAGYKEHLDEVPHPDDDAFQQLAQKRPVPIGLLLTGDTGSYIMEHGPEHCQFAAEDAYRIKLMDNFQAEDTAIDATTDDTVTDGENMVELIADGADHIPEAVAGITWPIIF